MSIRIWKDKRGTIEEAASTPPFLAIAGVLILIILGLSARWFYMLYIEPPPQWEGYDIANFERLGTEVRELVETNPAYMETRVIPYTFGKGERRSIVGINPNMPPPESAGCNKEGEIQFPEFCTKYPCLCLCEGTDCSKKKNCIAFKRKDVGRNIRFFGIDQEYKIGLDNHVRFNTGSPISQIEDPLEMDNLYELILYSHCGTLAANGWGKDDFDFPHTGYLYIEETRDARYSYIIIGMLDEKTEERQSKIQSIESGEGEVCHPLSRCIHQSDCPGEFGTLQENDECASLYNEEFVCCKADDEPICRYNGEDYSFGERVCGSLGNWFLNGCGPNKACGCNYPGHWTLDRINCKDRGAECVDGECV